MGRKIMGRKIIKAYNFVSATTIMGVIRSNLRLLVHEHITAGKLKDVYQVHVVCNMQPIPMKHISRPTHALPGNNLRLKCHDSLGGETNDGLLQREGWQVSTCFFNRGVFWFMCRSNKCHSLLPIRNFMDIGIGWCHDLVIGFTLMSYERRWQSIIGEPNWPLSSSSWLWLWPPKGFFFNIHYLLMT